MPDLIRFPGVQHQLSFPHGMADRHRAPHSQTFVFGGGNLFADSLARD